MTTSTIGEGIVFDETAIESNAMRFRAVRALPRELNGKLYVMCIRDFMECHDEDITSEPLVLLDRDEKEFYGLAERSGVERRYKYQLYKRLKESGAIGAPTSANQDLYRHFDAGRALLYVGISARLALREAAHKRNPSGWNLLRTRLLRHSQTGRQSGRRAHGHRDRAPAVQCRAQRHP